MRPSGRRRTIKAGLLSVAAHAVLLTALALHAPKLRAPEESSGPPQPIIPVLILPRVPPPEAGGPPAPIRLHRRPQRALPHEPSVAPLLIPKPPAESPRAEGPRPVAPSADDAVAATVRQALRGGAVGCANLRLLSREEREKCEERLGRGARDADFPGLGLNRSKAAEFDRAAARREADYRYKRGIPTSQPRLPGSRLEWDTSRSPPPGAGNIGVGATAKELGATERTVPF